MHANFFAVLNGYRTTFKTQIKQTTLRYQAVKQCCECHGLRCTMDLDLYIGNFDLKSISFFAEPDQEEHNVSQKHIDLFVSNVNISTIRFHGKSEEI